MLKLTTRLLRECNRLDGRRHFVGWLSGVQRSLHLSSIKAREVQPSSSYVPSFSHVPDSSGILMSGANVDVDTIQAVSKGLLNKYISDPEMLAIATNIYNCEGYDFIMCTELSLVISKMVKSHMYQNANLTEKEIMMVAIVELLWILCYLLDDLHDGTTVRFKSPSPITKWHSQKIIMTQEMLVGIIFGEAIRVSPPCSYTLGHFMEVGYRGQLMTERNVEPGSDRMAHYFMVTSYRSANTFSSIAKILAQSVKASDYITDVVMCMMDNVGMFIQLLDDIADLEEDLKNGWSTLPVLVASREFPVLQEMMDRRFTREGDVTEAVEIVQRSKGIQETFDLATRHYNMTMEYMKMIGDSEYKEGLEAFLVNVNERRKAKMVAVGRNVSV